MEDVHFVIDPPTEWDTFSTVKEDVHRISKKPTSEIKILHLQTIYDSLYATDGHVGSH